MSLIVPSTTTAILNVYAPPTNPDKVSVAAPLVAFRWEGSRVASVEFLPGTAPAPHPGGFAYRVRLDKPAGDSFPVGAPNMWPEDGLLALGLRWTCAGQGTPSEDRSEWYFSADKADRPFSFSAAWQQLPNGARSQSYYPIPI